MRKKFIIFLFVVLSVNLSAELHYFLPRNNAVMSILDHKYWFEGDTIIDNVRYTKVYRQKCKSEMECGELLYYAAVREDTIGEKIYAVYPCDSAMLPYIPYLCDEVLLADFNVQVGDQIDVYANWPWFDKRSVTINDIDSILIDNQFRKRINLVNYYNFGVSDSWVEGFGSITFGLFFPSPKSVCDVGDMPMFLCMHINGELVYRNPAYDTCFVRDSGTDIPFIKMSKKKIYYTVASDQLYIQGNYTYRIYDVCGSLVLSGNRTSTAINISRWATGIYFIQLYDDKKLVYTGKFVKH